MIPRQHPMLAAVLALILMVTLSSPALAATQPTPAPAAEPVHSVVNALDPATVALTMTEEQAIQKAHATFDIPESLGKPSVNLWSDSGKSGQGPTWNLNWEMDPRLGGTRVSYSVGIHAQSGEIVSYNLYQYDPSGKPQATNLTRDEAQVIADAWYAKLVPSTKTTEPQTNQAYMNNDFSFSWMRIESGIPFPDNSINITINPADGTLSSFYRSWDENVTFPKADKVVTVESAQAAYDKVGGVELVYQRIYTPAGRSEVKLVYVSKAQNTSIDALTGQVVDYNGQPWPGEGKPIDLGRSDVDLVKLEKPLTRDEALALARQYLGEDAKGDPSYDSYSSPGQPAGKFADEGLRVSVWNFSWDIQGKEANQNRYLSAMVDLEHGVLMSFNCYDGYVTDEQLRAQTPMSEEAARTAAIEYVKRVRPDLLNHLSITDRSVEEKYPYWPADRPAPIQREYYFSFRRMISGADGSRIRFDADSVSVSIDRFSGQVRNFYVNWSSPEFPTLETVKLTPAQALEAFHLETPLKLTYFRSYTPYSDGQPQVQLVYRPYNIYNGNLIDPTTGHLLDYSGKDVTELERGAEDIAEHPAKREIQQMIDRGIFEVKDGKFEPAKTMTRGDLAKALVIAFNQGYMVPEFNRMAAMGKGGGAPAPSYADVNYDNGYYGYVEAAVRAGILMPKVAGEKLNPDELVTNEEFALLTARAMGYATVINMKSTISNDFTDAAKIGTDYTNAVGLLAGLEVLSNEGEFGPQSQVTRADAAKVLSSATRKALGRYYY